MKEIPAWIIQDLEKSGLSLKDMEIIPLETEEQLDKYLGLRNHKIIDIGGYFIKYPGSNDYYRLKLKEKIGDAKYLSPKGNGNHVFMLPSIRETAQSFNPDKPLFFTEGEKKAAKATLEGFPTIGFSGVWCFKDKDNILLPELEDLNLKHRRCYICFDSDIIDKFNVRLAELRLAVEILNRGGIPMSIRIPNNAEVPKNGLDDYIVRHGKDSFHELLIKATPTLELHLQEKTPIDLLIKEISRIESLLKKDEVVKSIRSEYGHSLKNIYSEMSKHAPKDSHSINCEPTGEEIKQAQVLLREPEIVKKYLETVQTDYLGREKELTLTKLATISRKFKRGVSVVFKGTASVGKSDLVLTALKTVWPEDKEDFTRTSENYLLYREKPLDHKVITFFELHGTNNSAHIIRTALSDGSLKLGTVSSDSKNGLQPIEIEKSSEGLVLISTFASGSIDWELNTRVIQVEITHDEELARKVYLRKAKSDYEQPHVNYRIWQVADFLIEPIEVVIPYAKTLAELFPTNEERYLRDFQKILILIKSSALLNQYQREKDPEGRVLATKEDYEIVYELRDLISQSVSTVSENIKKFLEEADKLRKGEILPKRFEIQETLGVSERTIRRYIRFCIDEDLIEVTGKGNSQIIDVLSIPESISPMPEVEKIFLDRPDTLSDPTHHTVIVQQISDSAHVADNDQPSFPLTNGQTRTKSAVQEKGNDLGKKDDSDNRSLNTNTNNNSNSVNPHSEACDCEECIPEDI